MNMKLKKLSIISVILLFCFLGCSCKRTIEKDEFETIGVNEEVSKQMPIETVNANTWVKIGEEIKKLNDIATINEVAVTVNGQTITQKDIKTQEIYAKYLKNKTLSDYIGSIIRDKVIKAEAIRLSIKPSQESIDTYLRAVDKALEEKVVGTETIFALMEGMKISKKEYITLIEQTAYDMYQREALRKKVEEAQGGGSYEEYINTLVEKATIMVLDSELENIVESQG